MDNSRDERFQVFARNLQDILVGHGKNTTERQKAQVERLVKLEVEFRRALIRHAWGKYVYRDFVNYIVKIKRNILEARPYFRERNNVFTQQISDILRRQNARGLYKFHFNYNFVKFVMSAKKWHKGSKITKLRDQIVEARNELVEMNMLLAIQQANTFYSKMQKSHLDRMDFIQIATEGLISAIDKFCLPYTTVFRTVATYKMKGNFIDSYSETSLHFYPKDRRRLYQAYKYIKEQRGNQYDVADLVKYVNKHVKPNEKTNASEIVDLIGAASVVFTGHGSTTVTEADSTDATPVLERYAAPEASRPDIQVQEAEAYDNMSAAIKKLSIYERKLLRMKGVENV